ncbi:Peptidoglycan/LPS O-acetylase OafA/YrhL, contains acyltransferase and SGNH-hydrolase domains [Methylobacterium phyllostachyos]|uniref:Peptidoglycan/LPS O-acetylase OafA/YrhL, contains acyltransferase and SGNH-hydrolase domains n=1 Tax=Methylobacterium phyllostachyos TaxID=582672 RepID=A0A1G9R9U1_9HYPH|nr:acyltransferase [Methylobacterium phyllostachyos]SDM19901.1 Peptidoglycan/LPS O-acetylase OafA/YrhL, contains acyltransferase and SGNH-hydrolase domains [Methylobacterium phyllostachyos]
MKYNLQALRAYAAVSVVMHHILFSVQNYLAVGLIARDYMVGSTGVHVFFVISGYVITLTTRKMESISSFIHLRFSRVVPVYWLLTALTALMVLCGFKLFGLHDIKPSSIAASFFFLPDFVNGQLIKPILFVGWTLEYEIFFYFLFGLCMVFKRNLDALIVSSLILMLWISAHFIQNEYIDFYGDDLILCFVLGIAIFFAEKHVTLPATACYFGLCAGFVGLFTIDVDHLAFKNLIVVGASALLVFSALQLETNRKTVGRGFISRQGDASYSLYLIHPFVLQFIGKLSIVFGLNTTASGLLITAIAMLVFSIAVGYIFHRTIERRLIRAFRQRTPIALAENRG